MGENRTCETLSNGGDDSAVYKNTEKSGKSGNFMMKVIILLDMENQGRVEQKYSQMRNVSDRERT